MEQIGVGVYSELYILPRISFNQTLRIPLEIGSPPGFPEALNAYKKAENIGWEKFEEVITQGEVTQFSHIVNRSGHHVISDPGNGSYNAPVYFRTIVACSRGVEGSPQLGRIPILFYERPGGLLYLPEPKSSTEEFVKRFIFGYLGGQSKFSVKRFLGSALTRRYSELVAEGRTPQFRGKKAVREMKKSDFRRLKMKTKFGTFVNAILWKGGLDLDVAFLVPRIVPEDLESLVAQTEEHLNRLRNRSKV